MRKFNKQKENTDNSVKSRKYAMNTENSKQCFLWIKLKLWK